MAQVNFIKPVKNVRGKYGGTIMRQKKYRAPNGAVLREGVQESYMIENPRDYEKNPPQGAELANMRSFGEVSLLTTEVIRAGKYTEDELAAMTPEERARVEELRGHLEELRERFYAQFKKPDPEAPFEKKLAPGASARKRKQYSKLDNFIQAIIRERMKQQD